MLFFWVRIVTVKFMHKFRTLLHSWVVAEVRIRLYNMEILYFLCSNYFTHWSQQMRSWRIQSSISNWRESVGDNSLCRYICAYQKDGERKKKVDEVVTLHTLTTHSYNKQFGVKSIIWRLFKIFKSSSIAKMQYKL